MSDKLDQEITPSEQPFFPNSQKVYVSGQQHPELRVPLREITLEASTPHTHTTIGNSSDNGQSINEAENPKIRVYDTSGPWGDEQLPGDVQRGLEPLRQGWIQNRNDVETYPGRTVQPQDNGYRSQDQVISAQASDNRNGKLERFEGNNQQPLRAKSGHNVTQMHYAKRGIVTPEMEFIAIRENLGREEAYEAAANDPQVRNVTNFQHPGDSLGAKIPA